MDYSNKYGTATLTPVGPVVHVSAVVGTEVIDSGYGFDMDTAAKLALVTENFRLQPSYNMERKRFYVMYHHTPSTVQVCRLDALACTEEDPHATLSYLNKCDPVVMV
jgi:hypothetical protein